MSHKQNDHDNETREEHKMETRTDNATPRRDAIKKIVHLTSIHYELVESLSEMVAYCESIGEDGEAVFNAKIVLAKAKEE